MRSVLALSRSRVSDAYTKPTQISSTFEICSQIARTAAFAFTVLAATEGSSHWTNVATVGYAFVLGLVRLAVGPPFRYLAARQVNLVVFASLVFLIVSDFLPLLEYEYQERPSGALAGALASLAAANFITAATPRVWLPPTVGAGLDPRAPPPQPSPEETCSWINYYLTYEWITPLIWKGFRKQIELSDLPALPWYDEPLKLLEKVLDAREKSKQSTLWMVLRYQRVEITTMAIWVTLAFTVELVAPYALYNLLSYISAPDRAILRPGIWLFLMFVGPMSRTVFFQQYIFTSTRLVVRIKSGLTQELYHRAMTSMELEEDVINAIANKGAKEAGLKSTSAGRLANLMASDVDAIANGRDILMGFTGIPAGIILSVIGLYRIIGWSSLVGTAFMVIMTPVPAYVAQLMGASQRRVKMAQDSRISLLTEYLTSIKAIKYFAWEDAMTGHVQAARAKEQKDLWRISLLLTVMGEAAELIPVIALVLIFSTYVGVLKQPLTAPIAFTTLSLIMTMRRNIGMISFFARGAVNSWISMDRLDRYFKSTTPLTRYPTGPLTIKNATFRRNKKATFAVKDVSLNFVEGGLNVVSGQSGSGKTTLLLAILGETILENGSVTRPDDVAYASQTAWLQSETIRDNILFHSEFEQLRYDRVLEACCLGQDLEEMPKGDQTEVGENGTALSGGQKARVALARALYSKASLLLLDDVFSALDAKTAASVWKFCFCGDLLRGRTTILVAQMPWVPAQADLSIVMENGLVKSVEQNIGVVRKPVTLEHGPVEVEAEEAVHHTGETNGNGHGASNGNGTSNGAGADAKAAPAKPKQDDIADEMKASGTSNRLMFFKYMLYFGGPGYAIFALLTTVVANLVITGTLFWLSLWVNAYETQDAVDIAFYLGIYVAFAVGTIVIDAISFLAYANGAWIAAKRLHEDCLRSVMNVSLSWWKNIPVGRVVNRFSRDMGSLDNQLSRVLQGTLDAFVMIFFRIGAVSSILPVFMLPGLATCLIGVMAGEMYTRTAVVVRRLLSSSQSPVFSQFTDSVAGLAVIRSRGGMSQVFREKLAERLRAFSRAQEANFNCNRWVALRIDFVTALVSLLAGVIAVSKVGTLAAGLVGFSLANATGLSETILILVRCMNELEVEMQSVSGTQPVDWGWRVMKS